MDKEAIKKFYLLAAQHRKMSDVDPTKQIVGAALSQLEGQYAEFMQKVNAKHEADDDQNDTDEIPWQESLGYIGSLFQSLDGNDKEPNHADQVAMRNVIWNVVSNAVSNYYCKKQPEEPQKKD